MPRRDGGVGEGKSIIILKKKQSKISEFSNVSRS
jgi:hypothetical protein